MSISNGLFCLALFLAVATCLAAAFKRRGGLLGDPFAYLLDYCIHKPKCTVWRECSDLSTANIKAELQRGRDAMEELERLRAVKCPHCAKYITQEKIDEMREELLKHDWGTDEEDEKDESYNPLPR